MVVAVTGQLMPCGDDATNHGFVAFGDPAQGEERGADPRRGELLEDTIDIRLDAWCDAMPRGSIDAARERLHLEIILDVDRHRVADGRVHRSATALSRSIRRRNTRSCREDACSSASIRRTRPSLFGAHAAGSDIITAAGCGAARPAPRSCLNSAAVASTIGPVMMWLSSIAPYSSTREQSVLIRRGMPSV